MEQDASIRELIGKTLISITKGKDDDELLFITDCGESYRMYHYQNCCECVSIEDINGDLQDLIGTPILDANESSNSEDNTKEDESFTWTFYHISTIKGYVTIRWYGSSNGYYSEGVNFEKFW